MRVLGARARVVNAILRGGAEGKEGGREGVGELQLME